MAEKHVAYSIGTGTPNDDINYGRQILYHIYDFIKNSGQTAVRFADNAEATAVTTARSSYGSPSAYTDWSNGGYLVFESSTAMPSGNRWQCLITVDTDSADDPYLFFHFAPRGGWTPGSSPADPSVAATWSSKPVNLTRMDCWNYEYYVDEGAKALISSSDLDTYGAASSPVEYLRVNLYDATDGEGNQFYNCLRIGGYIPTDPTNDTNPACALAGIPNNPGGGNSYSWGDYDGSTRDYNFCIVPPDDDGTQTDLHTFGYAWISSGFSRNASHAGQYNYWKTRAGQWVNTPVWLFSKDAGACVGYFGKYDMFGGYSGRSDGTQDSSGEYIIANQLVMRWNTSA